jgi:Tfp pilus assembly protein PilO
MGRIVTLHDFIIERGFSENGKQKSTSGDQLRMEMTVKIYRYRTQ